jgi:hypothetical protein
VAVADVVINGNGRIEHLARFDLAVDGSLAGLTPPIMTWSDVVAQRDSL